MKRAFVILRDIFEVYLPVTAFVVLFVTFFLQVFFRYVIRLPLTWTMEIIVICFIWTVVLGACFTMRNRAHVKFTMIYDHLKPKPAAITRMIGNIIIVVTFLSLIPSSWSQIFFQGFQRTASLRIPYSVLFIPFVYFLISISYYTVIEIVEDIKVLKGNIPDSKDHSEVIRAVVDEREAGR